MCSPGTGSGRSPPRPPPSEPSARRSADGRASAQATESRAPARPRLALSPAAEPAWVVVEEPKDDTRYRFVKEHLDSMDRLEVPVCGGRGARPKPPAPPDVREARGDAGRWARAPNKGFRWS